jgi:hypothetical protein
MQKIISFSVYLTSDCSGDGVANPFEICLALGNEAIDKGVKVMEHCQVKFQLTLR